MAGMNNLKDVSNAFRLQNVQVGGDRVKAGFDPPPVVSAAAPAVVDIPSTGVPLPTAATPDATSTKSLQATARRRRSSTSATILGNGDTVDTLG